MDSNSVTTSAAPPAAAASVSVGSDERVIVVEGLGKRYELYSKPGDRLLQSLFRGRRQFFQEFWALTDVSFSVERGETVGIIGRNGSGKSTLLQMIAGTLAPTTGRVDIRGRVAALLELGSGFNPEFTGRENVYLNGAVLGILRNDIDARLDTIIAFSGLAEFIDRPVKTYSSGMLMRLAFSVAVNVEPDILIVDEALAVGDTAFQLKCLDRLDSLTRSGVTLLFVSHDVGLVKSFCRRAIYLDRGKVRAIGTPDDLSELYMFDTRREEGATTGRAVGLKPHLGGGSGIAFGTNEGRITHAAFVSSGTNRAHSASGNDVTFVVEMEFRPDVADPYLSVIVHDRNMREIGGRFFPLPVHAGADGVCRVRAECGFRVPLIHGLFSVTLRLESRKSPMIMFPIDKQVSALIFEVIQPDRGDVLGFVDLGIHAQIHAEEVV